MEVWIGVKAEEMQVAKRWLEEALGVEGVEKEHVDMGGEYFSFDFGEQDFLLINNFDVYDHLPLSPLEFAHWRLVVLGDDMPSVQSKIEALRARSDRFEVLAE